MKNSVKMYLKTLLIFVLMLAGTFLLEATSNLANTTFDMIYVTLNLVVGIFMSIVIGMVVGSIIKPLIYKADRRINISYFIVGLLFFIMAVLPYFYYLFPTLPEFILYFSAFNQIVWCITGIFIYIGFDLKYYISKSLEKRRLNKIMKQEEAAKEAEKEKILETSEEQIND